MINLAAGASGELIRLHRLEMQRQGLAAGSIAKRRQLLAHFAAWLEPVGLLEADSERIQVFLDGRAINPKSRYAYVSHLHTFYAWAIRAGWASVDPTIDIQRPKFAPGQPRPIDGAELRQALEAADPVTAVILAAAAYAGMRCCEIARMGRHDLRAGPQPLISVQGKGGKTRLVPLHPELAAALERHGIPRTGPVLRRADGRPLAAWEVSHRANQYLHGLGISATAHQLRHWFGTQTYRTSRHDLLLVASLMGHSSVTTTQIYAAFDRDGAYAAVAALAV
ncbi:MAG TPA: tyrosine-type recombinase/integrase [Acidimicrobiales bacterium]|jgi:integrase/recombinase XerC|nr:tyrosine-type recombinase/integrase [Trebonia sp.]